MKTLLFLLSIVLTANAFANDGAFFASGNQLIPIEESDIEISKEILTIERVGDYLHVTVDYTFVNNAEAKELLVGFEAKSPGGDVDGTPIDGQHPYMKNFSVLVNDQMLPYEVSLVNTETYFVNNSMASLSEEEAMGDNFDVNNPNFYYVYHFNVRFEPGVNKIIHKYQYRISGSVEMDFEFDYILTAANRWANKQIDDFTLILDLGNYSEYYVSRNFFSSFENWKNGIFLEGDNLPYMFEDTAPMYVLSKEGIPTFHQTNFHPEDELRVFAPHQHYVLMAESFDYKELELPYSSGSVSNLVTTTDEVSYKILRNLPYARRGYVFKTKSIQKYYEKMPWYQPDPKYVAKPELLTEEEQEWLKLLKENHE